MIKESRYILRRILIGVGIVLCVSFINSCKVKAYDNLTNDSVSTTQWAIIDPSPQTELLVHRNYANYDMYIYHDFINNDIYICSGTITCRKYAISDYNFTYDSVGVQLANSSSKTTVILTNGGLPSCDASISCDINSVSFNFGKPTMVLEFNRYDTYNMYLYYSTDSPYYMGRMGNEDRYKIYATQSTWHYSSYSSDVYQTFSITPVSNTPKFVSWNYKKLVNNNILMGYSFELEFSSFDTNNYIYQYKVGEQSTTWLGLSQNKQSIDINANTTLYVRVKDMQNNVIDGASFIVKGVGNFTNSQNIKYDINFTGEYRTGGDLQGNQAGGSAIIDEYQIYTDFIPNSSILKYQYQWVPTGSSLDSNSWVDVILSPTDYGDFTYVVDENGIFYARILDSDNNLKYSATFTVNTIGKLAIDSGNDKITDKFMSISNKLNIGGPISGIIEVPLKVINIIGTGLAGGLTCSDYSLGSLWGTNLVIPCVNVKQHLGNSLYNTIDIIIACVMIYNIYKMIMDMYTNFIFMRKNPVQELGDRGD